MLAGGCWGKQGGSLVLYRNWKEKSFQHLLFVLRQRVFTIKIFLYL